MKTLTALLAAAALMTSLDGAAQTPRCGTIIYSSITFNQDLRCPAGVSAITVWADNVRIELNGHKITGPYSLTRPTARASAIRSFGFNAVEVIGPGQIEGFSDPIMLDDGNRHVIERVEIDESIDVSLRNTSGSRVAWNRLVSLRLWSDPGESSSENVIVHNEIGTATSSHLRGINLEGSGTAHNLVAGNFIDFGYANAITLHDGARANQVTGNKVLGSIVLHQSRDNLVSRNYVELDPRMFAAITLDWAGPTAGGPCGGASPAHTVGNTVVDNDLVSGQVGVHLEGSPYCGLKTNRNVITGNVMRGQTLAHLYFTPGADDNDARGNHFPGQTPTVTDNGIGNLWP